jgi:tripartite-type tricarboxylate transporter receptor subunit TctC
MRKLFLGRIAATLGIGVLSGLAAAQVPASFSTRPITIVIAGGTGTGLDQTVRLFAPVISKLTGQQAIIDYKGGASGTIGSAYLAKATPDGHTIMAQISSYGIVPALYPDLPFDPLKDIAPLTQLTEYFYILTLTPSLPVDTLAEYLKYVRANPGKLNFATSGQGSGIHIAGELLHHLTKTKVTYIHYKTGQQRDIDFLGGRLHAQFSTPRSFIVDRNAGKAKGAGITSPQRLSIMPDMPTIAEQGVPGFEFSGWNAMFAPGRTPPNVLNYLHSLFAQAGKDPDIVTKMAAFEQAIVTSSPDQWRKKLTAEINKYKDLAKAANIKLEN